MKVDETHTRFKEFEEAIGIGSRKKTKKVEVKEKEKEQHTFAEKIRQEALKGIIKEELTILIKKIEESGKVLINSPTYENLINYKELVSAFIQYAVQHIWKIEEKRSGRFVATQKIDFILKKIDENLLLLTEEVLKKEQDVLKIIARIDEIQGLLIDLYS